MPSLKGGPTPGATNVMNERTLAECDYEIPPVHMRLITATPAGPLCLPKDRRLGVEGMSLRLIIG